VLASQRLLLLLLVALSGCQNFGVVDAGRVYRSAQLDSDTLRAVLNDNQIATVLNLRGANTAKAWYRDELEVCRRAAVAHESVRWSARRWPRPEEILAALDVLRDATYPVLIHCRGGADRTGLAAALYRIVWLGETVTAAETELSIRYLHLGRLGGTEALDQFLDLYEETGAQKPLRRWVTEDYEHERDRHLGRVRSRRLRGRRARSSRRGSRAWRHAGYPRSGPN
jgi:protein tyrosine/serine phosphatase